MNEISEAGRFYEQLSEEQKKDMTEAIAEDIFFLDEQLQEEVVKLLRNVNGELGDKIKQRNDFTI